MINGSSGISRCGFTNRNMAVATGAATLPLAPLDQRELMILGFTFGDEAGLRRLVRRPRRPNRERSFQRAGDSSGADNPLAGSVDDEDAPIESLGNFVRPVLAWSRVGPAERKRDDFATDGANELVPQS